MRVRGPSIDELVIGDSPDAWRAAGFEVDGDGTCRIGTVRVRLAGPDGGRRIRAWTLRGADLDGDTIDGLATTASARPPAVPAEHPNGSVVIDHVVVLTPDMARTVAALSAARIEPRRTRDVDPEQYGFAARQTFFRLGEVILELIGPADAADAPVDADHSASFFGLAVTVDDIDALAGRYGDAIGRVKDAVQPGRRITTLRHKPLDLSVAIAFMSPGDGAV